jgi:hypothetical protein
MDPVTLKAVELAKESSDRARTVLLIMQVTCIIAFMAAWREAPFGWTLTRLRIAQAVVWYLDCQGMQHPETPGVGPDANRRSDECNAPGGGQAFGPAEIKLAKAYLAGSNVTPAQAKRHLENLQDMLVTHTMNVTVPFLGFTFDVNDLSVLGGMSFLLILGWFYFSLRREELNIALLFQQHKGQALKEVYTLASMTQVFTVTPKAHGPENKFKIKVLGLVLRLLFFSPLAVQSFVLGIDAKTLGRVEPFNPHLVKGQLAAGVLFFMLMLSVTWRCLRRSRAVDKIWQEANSQCEVPEETTPSDNSRRLPVPADS